MIRIISFFLITVGSSSSIFCQTTVFSLGLSQRTERSTYQNDEFVKNTNNYLFAGWGRIKENSSWEIGLSFYNDEINIDSYSERFIRSENVYFQRDRVYSKADVSYAFLGVRISRESAIFKRKRSSIIWAPFFHIETPVMEKEKNHSRFSTMHEWITYPGQESDIMTTEPINYNKFNAVNLKSLFWSLGIKIALKYSWGRYYTSPYYSIGVQPKWRVHDNRTYRYSSGSTQGKRSSSDNNVSERQNRYIFQEFGITIGRSNKKK